MDSGPSVYMLQTRLYIEVYVTYSNPAMPFVYLQIANRCKYWIGFWCQSISLAFY